MIEYPDVNWLKRMINISLAAYKPCSTPNCPRPTQHIRAGKPLCDRCIKRAEPITSELLPLPGRNAPCPCKSGKKFKQCCMRASNERHSPE